MTDNILMVSDFFYPDSGGIETHIYYLAQCLISLGNKVVVATHQRSGVYGVRYMKSGLKAFYLPLVPFYNNTIFPLLVCSTSLIRDIIIREKITLVHAHSATSPLANESLTHASLLNIPTVFTDHSLFGFADLSSVLMKQLLRVNWINVDVVICVSHTSKENTVLRAALKPEDVYVIPNAVVPWQVCFNENQKNGFAKQKPIIIAIASRLAYRKGIDLVVRVIPHVCQQFDNVQFVIAGDGPKMEDLKTMCEFYGLQNRVVLLGMIAHCQIKYMLESADIYLSCSLTEAFCVSILEAAYAGLLVVSTHVGGVPEVLPIDDDVILFTQPKVQDITDTLGKAIGHIRKGRDKKKAHVRIAEMVKLVYNWPSIAVRTEKAYAAAKSRSRMTWTYRFRKCISTGYLSGMVVFILFLMDAIYMLILDLFLPHPRQ